MGHWLDDLLGATRVKDDGEELPRRRFLNVVGLNVADDEVNDQVTITGPTFLEMSGNVIGDSDDNTVISISGDEETGVVTMFATGLQWDDHVAASEPALIINTNGAIELWNDAKRAFAGEANGAIVGNPTGINQFVGGAQFTVRSITGAGNVTLDGASKDMLIFVVADGERNITLPAPSAGRMLLFIITGATAQSLRRGAALINGLASHYATPADSRIWVVSDGTNWYTFAGLQ
jgi:hypothetical protein